jgi:transmembrane sensor
VGLSRLKPQSLVRRQAIGWLARLRGGETAEVKVRFNRWYNADRRHAQAFDLERERFEKDYGLLRSSAFAGSATLSAEEQPRVPQVRYALAAILAAVLLIPAGLLLVENGSFRGNPTKAMMLVSQVGEIRKVTLSDGSKVTLDSQSALKVELGPKTRWARLERGRARFQIGRSTEPFIVTAGPVEIRSQGAIVDVDHQSDASHVEVRAGSVGLKASDAPPSVMTAGEGFAAVGSEQHRLHSLSAADWASGMLSFEASPLSRVVEVANRYSIHHIILSDSSLARLEITGVFHANDIEGLARALATTFSLELKRSPTGDLVLSPGTPARERKKTTGVRKANPR